MSDKVQGMARDAAGRVQQVFGETIGDARTQAQGLYNQASGQAQEQAGRLAEVIRDQPLTSALIALGVGYILGRLTG
ncbi:MAG: CsbD family protein [Acetobacteraceae bacterium]